MAGARVGINGFGRIGRLALRAARGWPELDFVHVNELNGDAATSAHLLTFDSVHGRWPHHVHGGDAALAIEVERVSYGSFAKPGEVPWSEHGVDVVIECSGRFRTREALDAYFRAGVRKVIVAAPVKQGALNVVVGVNDHLYDPDEHDLLHQHGADRDHRGRADRVRRHLRDELGRALLPDPRLRRRRQGRHERRLHYMANAAGRLTGTVLSGLLYQWQGLGACLWASVVFVLAAGVLSLLLPRTPARRRARSRGAAAPA